MYESLIRKVNYPIPIQLRMSEELRDKLIQEAKKRGLDSTARWSKRPKTAYQIVARMILEEYFTGKPDGNKKA